MLAMLLGQLEQLPKRMRGLATTYAVFLQYAFDPKTARFRTIAGVDCDWLAEQGAKEWKGRAIWVQGRVYALPAVMVFAPQRAWTVSPITIHEYLCRINGDRPAKDVREELTRRLVTHFGKTAKSGWASFEEMLTNDSARLSDELIAGGSSPGLRAAYERNIQAMRRLVGARPAPCGQLRPPIGSNGSGERNIDPQSTVPACLEAHRITAVPWWNEQAQRACDPFSGWSDLELQFTLAFLLSLVEMRLKQRPAAGAQGPVWQPQSYNETNCPKHSFAWNLIRSASVATTEITL
jgi:hypothetical protein